MWLSVYKLITSHILVFHLLVVFVLRYFTAFNLLFFKVFFVLLLVDLVAIHIINNLSVHLLVTTILMVYLTVKSSWIHFHDWTRVLLFEFYHGMLMLVLRHLRMKFLNSHFVLTELKNIGNIGSITYSHLFRFGCFRLVILISLIERSVSFYNSSKINYRYLVIFFLSRKQNNNVLCSCAN